MKRRTFLQAAAGIATFPFLPELKEVHGVPKWVIDRCCDKDWCRYDLSEPAVQNGIGFATDGRIMLALDDVNDYASAESIGRFPDCVAVMKRLWSDDGNWRPWKAVEQDVPNHSPKRPHWDTCLKCWGEGVMPGWSWCTCTEHQDYCHESDGGVIGLLNESELKNFPRADWTPFEQEWGWYVVHRRCHQGKAGTVCPDCNGEGGQTSKTCLRVDGRIVANTFDHLLKQIPGVEFRHRPNATVSEPFCFRYRGGTGMVMPISIDA